MVNLHLLARKQVFESNSYTFLFGIDGSAIQEICHHIATTVQEKYPESVLTSIGGFIFPLPLPTLMNHIGKSPPPCSTKMQQFLTCFYLLVFCNINNQLSISIAGWVLLLFLASNYTA
jgi:hypothetical protein